MPLDGTLYEDDEILRVLRAAQERIRLPENWYQGNYSNVSEGHWDDIGATAWCAEGAFRIEDGDPHGEAWGYVISAAGEIDDSRPCDLNDYTDHPTTLAMFDRARELRLADMMESIGAL